VEEEYVVGEALDVEPWELADICDYDTPGCTAFDSLFNLKASVKAQVCGGQGQGGTGAGAGVACRALGGGGGVNAHRWTSTQQLCRAPPTAGPDRRLLVALQSKWFSMSQDDLEDGECRGLWVADDPESKLDDWLGYRYGNIAKWQAAKKKNFDNFKKARRLTPCWGPLAA
jgi:hypothetical protein